MSRFVVVVNSSDRISEAAGEYGGDVLDERSAGGDQVAAVVEFEDEAAGGSFSRALNGTVYGVEWAARENARHRATGSV